LCRDVRGASARRWSPQGDHPSRSELFEDFVDEGHGFLVIIAGMQTVHSVKMAANLLFHVFQMTIIVVFRMASAVVVQFEDVNGQLATVIPGLVALLPQFLVRIQVGGTSVKLVQQFIQLPFGEFEVLGEQNLRVSLEGL
jgi:hypothetical protein